MHLFSLDQIVLVLLMILCPHNSSMEINSWMQTIHQWVIPMPIIARVQISQWRILILCRLWNRLLNIGNKFQFNRIKFKRKIHRVSLRKSGSSRNLITNQRVPTALPPVHLLKSDIKFNMNRSQIIAKRMPQAQKKVRPHRIDRSIKVLLTWKLYRKKSNKSSNLS